MNNIHANNNRYASLRVVVISSIMACVVCPGVSLADDGPEAVEEIKSELQRLKNAERERADELNKLQQQIESYELLMQRGMGAGSPYASAKKSKDQQGSAYEGSKPVVVAQSSTDKQGEVIKEAPASRSAQAVYQEQNALFGSKFTLETGFTYTRTDRKQLMLNGFLALDSIFLGDISVDDVKSDIITLDLLGRWGITPRFQMDLAAPFIYRSTKFLSKNSSNVAIEETVDSDSDMELGDVSIGLYYQLLPETISRPDVVWNFRIKAPTGTDPYGIKTKVIEGSDGNLEVPESLPSGNGVWAFSTGLSFVKTIDPAIMFANLSLFYNRPEKFSDISSVPGSSVAGEIKLGDSFQYGLGTAFAINETSSISFSFSHRLTAKSSTRVSGGEWIDIVGSDGNTANLNIGMTHALSPETSMVVTLGIGLTPDAPDMSIGVKFPHMF